MFWIGKVSSKFTIKGLPEKFNNRALVQTKANNSISNSIWVHNILSARSSFRRSTLWHFARARIFWYWLNGRNSIVPDKNPLNGNWTTLVFIDAKMVTIDANPMPLVHSILYCHCTRCIGFASIVTVLSPLKTKNYTHVFFLLPFILYYGVHKIRLKNWLTDRHLSQNHRFWTAQNWTASLIKEDYDVSSCQYY